MVEIDLPLRLSRDGSHVASDTTAFVAGSRVIVLRTASADLELVLYSTYVGDDTLDVTLVSELFELGSQQAELTSRQVEVGEGAFTYTRRFALYDHLGRLQALTRERLGAELRFEGLELALRELDPAAV